VVAATDANGMYVPGRCQVLDAAGADHTTRFRVRHGATDREGEAGELLAGGPNELANLLPPGVYELTFDFGQRGALRHNVTVRAREHAEVRLRL
jgi:hypothetical protein